MSTSSNVTVVPLPEVMDIKEAAALASRLRDLRGRPVMLDASHVKHLGGLCLQVLLTARNSWATDNCRLVVGNSSSPFAESMLLFGVSSFTAQERIG